MKNLDPGEKGSAFFSNENKPELIWLDNQDIKSLLHISDRTLQKWRDDFILPFYKVCGKIWYLKSELDELLLKNKVASKKKQ
jgi:hypothetical protein